MIRAFFPPLPLPLTELIDYLSIHSSRPMINYRKSIFFLSSAFVHFPLYIDLLAVGARLTPYSLLLRLSAVLFVQRDYFNMGRCHARATANNLQLLPVFCNWQFQICQKLLCPPLHFYDCLLFLVTKKGKINLQFD